ncbi:MULTISPECIES: hypothetical protein [unclassified Leptospira]|uniref:hypothetical protein n=1 Tax=unclassified Leptospira TaxID=2633828 RepID=UPI001E4D61CC|nr:MULTISPECIES: hypothetical protein [unclassified Leptospira]
MNGTYSVEISRIVQTFHSILSYLKFALISLCVSSILRIFMKFSEEYHYSMFLNFFLFFKYFGVLFLISFLPTTILFLIVKSLLREHRYFLRIGFVSFICVDSLVLEGLEMFAASFD